MGPSDSREWHRTGAALLPPDFTAEQRQSAWLERLWALSRVLRQLRTQLFFVDGPDALTGSSSLQMEACRRLGDAYLRAAVSFRSDSHF